MIKNTFDFHVDAKYFNFMWGGPMYITVSYTAWKAEGVIKFTLDNMTAPPFLIGSIVLNGSWWDVDVQMNAAAHDHAEKSFSRNNHVDETVMSAIAPHI